MNGLAITIVCVLGGLVILQALSVAAFVSSLRSSSQQTTPDDQLPKAAVILCVRGTNPSLANCVRALLDQNYPQYSLQIVVDSREDPAWKIVKDATIEHSRTIQVRVSPLREHYETCSLKCSALVQALSELDDSHEIVALIDADVIPHPNWLRHLAAPLVDKQVGATTGLEWYMPQSSQWGSLVRYLWFSGSAVSMYLHQIPWGGSMALELSSLSRSRLLEMLKQALCEDASIGGELRKLSLKVKFVPTLMLVNRQEGDLASFLRQTTRYLLWTRLYHPSWITILTQILITVLALVLTISLLLTASIGGHFGAAAWLGGGLVGYILALFLLLAFGEQGVRRVVREQGEPVTRYSALTIARIMVSIPLTQLLTGVVAISAILARSVEWSGITYQIEGPWNARLLKYIPYQHSSQEIMSSKN